MLSVIAGRRTVLTTVRLRVVLPCFHNRSVARIKDSQWGFALGSTKKFASIFVYFVIAVELGIIVNVVCRHYYSLVKSSILAYTYRKFKPVLKYGTNEVKLSGS